MHYMHSKAWHQARMQALARTQRGFIINPYVFGTVGTDPNFANVVSLLHFDGTNNSPTFTDQVPARTWTAVTGANISTAQSVFGGASGSFDGASGYIYSADHADWDFGSGDFTLEGRARFFGIDAGANYSVLGKNNVGGYGPWQFFKYGTAFTFFSSSNGTTWDIASAVSIGTVAADTWYSWAVSRVGTSIYIFLDGVLVNTVSSSATLVTTTTDVEFGRFAGASYYRGFMDEFRATKGVGRYTGNYTLAASAFPNS